MATHHDPVFVRCDGNHHVLVGNSDFNINFTLERCVGNPHWTFLGTVRSYNLTDLQLAANPRLEHWHPRLAGSVRWHERTWDFRMSHGEMQFGPTMLHTPIIVFNADGKPIAQWYKGQLDLR